MTTIEEEKLKDPKPVDKKIQPGPQPEDEIESMVCPKCGKLMIRKPKGYFQDDEHWGYPDMIMKGSVRPRTK